MISESQKVPFVTSLLLLCTMVATVRATNPVTSLPFDRSHPVILINEEGDSVTYPFLVCLSHNDRLQVLGVCNSTVAGRYVGGCGLDYLSAYPKAVTDGFCKVPPVYIHDQWNQALARPVSERIDDTVPIDNPAYRKLRDLVLQHGSVAKPVVLAIGGSSTPVASAYLLAVRDGRGAEFITKAVVCAIFATYRSDPGVSTREFNINQDVWAAYICLQKLRTVWIPVRINGQMVGPTNDELKGFINKLPPTQLSAYTKHLIGAKNVTDGDAPILSAMIYPQVGSDQYIKSVIPIAFDRWGNPMPKPGALYGHTPLNALRQHFQVKEVATSDDLLVIDANRTIGLQHWKQEVQAAYDSVKDNEPYRTSRIVPATQGPLYWQYKGKPVLLLGGTDDDNLFQWSYEDKIKHLDLLKAAGGNYIRNTMSDRPDPERYPTVHYAFKKLANGQYDLNQWNEVYWQHFVDLLELCRERDIIVQLEIWDRFDFMDRYSAQGVGWWGNHPFRPANNINYTNEESGLPDVVARGHNNTFLSGVPGHPDYYTASTERRAQYDRVRAYQERYVRKIVSRALPYDNVLYCMNNETHVHEAWGLHWIRVIRQAAAQHGKEVTCCDMMDHIFKAQDDKERLPALLKHRTRYDYLDISQLNSRHLGQRHWDKTEWVVEQAQNRNYLCHMTKLYGADGTTQSWMPGDTNNAIEEWWQNLILGVAGQRFHRPPAGLGLSQTAQACITATRKIEQRVKFWEVVPRMDLLTQRTENEAYLAANPGQAYILYVTAQDGDGVVTLDLAAYPDRDFMVHWVNIQTGKWGLANAMNGGDKVTLAKPGPGHWAAALVKTNSTL